MNTFRVNPIETIKKFLGFKKNDGNDGNDGNGGNGGNGGKKEVVG